MTEEGKSDYYIHEGDDCLQGIHFSSVIRSIPHLEERLGIAAPRERSYGTSKFKGELHEYRICNS